MSEELESLKNIQALFTAIEQSPEVTSNLAKLIGEHLPDQTVEMENKWLSVSELLIDQSERLFRIVYQTHGLKGKIASKIEMHATDGLKDELLGMQELLSQAVTEIAKAKAFFGDKTVFSQNIRQEANTLIDTYVARIATDFGIEPKAPVQKFGK